MNPYYGLFGIEPNENNKTSCLPTNPKLDYNCNNLYNDSNYYNYYQQVNYDQGSFCKNANEKIQNNCEKGEIISGNFLTEENNQEEKNLENHNLVELIKEKKDFNTLNCAICCINKFKYKCPSCFLKTCSLHCFKNHKVTYCCNGLKNSLKYKKVSDFNDKQIKEDFFFLEECNRKIDNLKRDKKRLVQTLNELPSWLKKLRYEANCRNIKLMFLPAGFQKRLLNKSTFMYTLCEIHWDLELVFPDIFDTDQKVKKNKSIKIMYHRISENKFLKEILDLHLKPVNLLENPKQNKALKFYQEADINDIIVLLEQPCKKFIQINQNETICQVLKNKTIIEYPTIFIILKENYFKYN